jgi:tight adherence protein C
MSITQRLGAAVGIAAALGVILILTSLPWFRRRSLIERVSPFAGHMEPGVRRSAGDGDSMTALLQPLVVALAGRTRALASGLFSTISGDEHELMNRLRAAGRAATTDRVAHHRQRQLMWFLAGLTVGLLGVSAIASSGRHVPLVAGALLVGLSSLSAVLLHDHHLSAAIRSRRELMAAELPPTAELLALAVGAGESTSAALERVGRVSSGALAAEFAAAAEAARAGASVLQCLGQIADSVDLPPLRRMVDAISIAVDRGTPLGEVLRAQAADLRAEMSRASIESAGRKEIAMLLPVVFLVMPTVVVVALYPGWQTLQMVTR